MKNSISKFTLILFSVSSLSAGAAIQNTSQLNEQPTPDVSTADAQASPSPSLNQATPQKPTLTGKSAEVAQERVRTEAAQILQQTNYRPVANALSIVEETRRAQQLLESEDTAGARSLLETTIGKLDTLVSSRPSEPLVPISVDLKVIDTQPDEATRARVSKDVNSLINNGRYQAARLALKDVASEINILTTNIPLTTFPAALRRAVTYIDQGKNKNALTETSNALYTLAHVETAIPLPVVRAEALIDEANRILNATQGGIANSSDTSTTASTSPSPTASPGQIQGGASGAASDPIASTGALTTTGRQQIETLLRDADQQLRLAEDLGYGVQKNTYENLRQTINSIQSTVSANRETKGLFAKAKTSLAEIKASKRRR